MVDLTRILKKRGWRFLAPILISSLVFLISTSVFLVKGNLTAPLVGDEGDYVNRGVMFANEGYAAIADAYRPPFLIFIISAISHFLHGNDLIIAVKLFNLALVSAIPAAWLHASNLSLGNRGIYTLMALFTSIWPPFFYFGTMVLAEGISFFALNILIIITLSFSSPNKLPINIIKCFACGVVIAILTLSKANNILVAPACAIVTFFIIESTIVDRVLAFLTIVIISAILIFPWVNFVHNVSGEYKLTTTSGLNLLVGTGHSYMGMSEQLDQSVLPDKYISKNYDFHQTPSGPSALSIEEEMSLSNTKDKFELDSKSKQIGMLIWREHPIKQSIYGGLKVLHSLGGSLRGVSDYVLILFTVITILCSIFCLIKGVAKPIIYLHWLIAFAGFFVTFIFLPNIRFKTFYFDTTALLVLSATIALNFPRNKFIPKCFTDEPTK